jgi:hypothetical protein
MKDLEKDRIILEIGYISIQFNSFELLINELNASLINVSNPEIGHLILCSYTISKKCELCKELINLFPLKKDLKDELIYILKEFELVRKERNKFAHGFLHDVYDELDNKIDGFYIHNLKNFSINSVKLELKEIKQIREKLQELIIKQGKLNVKLVVEYQRFLLEKESKMKKVSDMLAKDQTF